MDGNQTLTSLIRDDSASLSIRSRSSAPAEDRGKEQERKPRQRKAKKPGERAIKVSLEKSSKRI